jgi:hypothetical protein
LSINEPLIRNFIWNAVKLKNFNVPQEAYQKYMTQQHRLGSDILVVDFPKFFESSSLVRFNELLSNMACSDLLWLNKLPYIAAFGYSQGILIHEVRGGKEIVKKNVGLTSSIFNVGICLFDYIVDEFSHREKIFEIINYDSLFELLNLSSPMPSSDYYLLKYNDPIDNRESLLLSLVVAFSVSSRLLYQRNESDKAWIQLSESIFQLYEAEKKSCELHLENVAPSHNNCLLNILKCKSVMPSLSTYYISKVASPSSSKNQENKIKEICETIGIIFWIADDLADIAKDLKAGTPNYITINTPSILQKKNNIFEFETFCENLIPSIECLLNLLEKLDQQLQSLSISINIHRKVMEFVKMCVTAWIGN